MDTGAHLRRAMLALVIVVSAPAALAEPMIVEPGTILRWPAPGADLCSLDEERWIPLDGDCFFPIDLGRTGFLTLAVRRDGRWSKARARIGSYPYPEQHITLKDDSRVRLSPENLARSRRERESIDALWQRTGRRRFSLPLQSPLEDPPPGSRFGARRVFNGEPRSPHTGTDYAVAAGTPVRATETGLVVIAEEHFFGGNSIFLDHGDGLISMYFHLQEIGVEAGQTVDRGQQIGTVGSTGRSSGPHLHFGIRWHGARIDPTLLLTPVEQLTTITR